MITVSGAKSLYAPELERFQCSTRIKDEIVIDGGKGLFIEVK